MSCKQSVTQRKQRLSQSPEPYFHFQKVYTYFLRLYFLGALFQYSLCRVTDDNLTISNIFPSPHQLFHWWVKQPGGFVLLADTNARSPTPLACAQEDRRECTATAQVTYQPEPFKGMQTIPSPLSPSCDFFPTELNSCGLTKGNVDGNGFVSLKESSLLSHFLTFSHLGTHNFPFLHSPPFVILFCLSPFPLD